ncbi:MAG: hypothetical protein ABIQ64_00065 [Candidatus Saccharimonadales bacterium]
MIDREYIAKMQQERYDNYLVHKQINFAPKIGTEATNLCLATVTLGLTEASTPYAGEFESKTPENINILGATALNVMNPENTVHQAIHAQKLALAA